MIRRGLKGSVWVALVLVFLAGVAPAVAPISDEVYMDKVRGAWLGKCIGGALGMPIEGWPYSRIESTYPKITGYLGYFTDGQVGWSGQVQSLEVPKDGQWHAMEFRVSVPAHDTAKDYAAPIIGLSPEFTSYPVGLAVRSLRIAQPKADIPSNGERWMASGAVFWDQDGVAQYVCPADRAWLRLRQAEAKGLALKPGDTLVITLEAQWTGNDNHLGLAFDWLSREPRKGFGPDDDTSYQIVGLNTLEKYGPDISCKQLGTEWCASLPAIDKQLAEGLALERMRSGIEPPESGRHPIGEAIGGQMKGELWGLICPGNPKLAAEYARRDGVVAHCDNGVYGEQFIAAMMSAAFEEKDTRKIIEMALKEIPADSKYAETVRWVLQMHDAGKDYREVRAEVVKKYPNACNPVYADTGIVTLALLYGEGDFEKTITTAASCGSDTDCDTASVGALIGCILGANALPAKWIESIGDEFRCFVQGSENWSIAGLSTRICALGRRVAAHHGKGMLFTAPV
jgi:ADP-ribosylglycohydrolase